VKETKTMPSLASRTLRLRREYCELLASPIANCAAEPLEHDIGIWHANIYVPALEITFHFEIDYPHNYPKQAPKVKNCTKIEHPNVFGTFICLDILTMSAETANTPFRGWTPAYTISSLLVQLQSFLFEAISEENSRSWEAREMTKSAATFICFECGHSTHHPTPEIVCLENGREETSTTSSKLNVDDVVYFFLDECDNNLLSTLLEFTDQETLGKICFLLEDVTHIVDLAFAKRSYKCFYTLKKLDDYGTVLGLGAKRFIMPRRSRKTGRKTNQLQQLHCSFDYLSHDAFQRGVRNNIWKDRDFDCFIPLYINGEHGRRSLLMAEEYILHMWNCEELPVLHKRITADLILDTLRKLMNTTVVNMMKTVEDLEAGELQLFDSIKALGGYTSMHHLLLAFCDRYPSIQIEANNRVVEFIKNPLKRDKEITPDIGELLIDLAISDYSWDDFSPAWIEEVFIRNARWILAKYPNLFEKEKSSSCIRLTQSFHATRTGKRLAMFQRFFISEVASPERLKGNPNKNQILLKEYNERLGMPQKGMAESLQTHSRKVIACNNWWDYFTLVDFCVPSAAHLSAWLRNSIEVSKLKQYHEGSRILHFSESFITKRDETTQLEKRHCLCSGSLFKLPENCREIDENSTMELVQQGKVGVDICFVMDCTGSMAAVLDTAKKHILDVVSKTSRKFDGETVRFSIVGYRDHDSPGYGEDSFVLKKFDFTSDPLRMERNVKKFKIGGGGGPEAMCCAMAAAANMSWNRDSHQIVVLIGDQPPHGYVHDYDSYDNGCPCGEDTLRVVHTMTKNGIVVYPVDCGSPDPERQTFYHALARISGGYAFDISEVNLLPEIVVSACVQEGMMEKLKNNIEPLYLECIESHPSGRFEQHCQSIYAQCKAKGVNVNCSLPADGYEYHIEKQVDCIAYCMDIKHARKMATSEYFMNINRRTKLCSYMERPVSLSQVTTCMKRMNASVQKANFLKNGCQYLSSDRFSIDDFKLRWKDFKAKRKIKNFVPWNKLNDKKIRRYRSIPNPVKKNCIKPLESPRNLITHNLCGRFLEVELHGVWTRVKIVKLLRNGKISVTFRGVEFSINEANNWRPASTVAPWSKKTKDNSETSVEASPILLRKLELLKSKRRIVAPPPTTTRKNVAPTTTTRKNVAIPSTTTRKNVAIPSSSSAYSSDAGDSGHSRPSSSTPDHNFIIGQLVYVRNSEDENWRKAVVGSLAPLAVSFQKNGSLQCCRYVSPVELSKCSLRCDAPVLSNLGEQISTYLKGGTEVHILETVNNFVHIVKPLEGWISIAHLSQPSGRGVVQNRSAAVNHQSTQRPRTPPIPTLVISSVPENVSSRDIAMMCMEHGVTPKNIKKINRQGLVAIVQFSTHMDAEWIFGLRLLKNFMPIRWTDEYYQYMTSWN